MMALLKTPTDSVAARRLSDASAHYNAMMRTTIVPTMLSAGHAENALPQTACAVVNCRMLPDDNAENVMSTLQRILKDSLITIRPLNDPYQSPPSPLRKDVMTAVEKLTAAMWPGVVVTPIMSTGATDGSSLRRAGIPVYGISGMFANTDDVRAHGKDERLGVREFYEGVDFMYRLITALASRS
jgi:acetylornithine deacetylase/succinyl-diaminopimelate desuccinylase-like protein